MDPHANAVLINPAIDGLVRHLFTIGAGYLVGKGLIDASVTTDLIGVAMGLVGVVWSLVAKKL